MKGRKGPKDSAATAEEVQYVVYETMWMVDIHEGSPDEEIQEGEGTTWMPKGQRD